MQRIFHFYAKYSCSSLRKSDEYQFSNSATTSDTRNVDFMQNFLLKKKTVSKRYSILSEKQIFLEIFKSFLMSHVKILIQVIFSAKHNWLTLEKFLIFKDRGCSKLDGIFFHIFLNSYLLFSVPGQSVMFGTHCCYVLAVTISSTKRLKLCIIEKSIVPSQLMYV